MYALPPGVGKRETQALWALHVNPGMTLPQGQAQATGFLGPIRRASKAGPRTGLGILGWGWELAACGRGRQRPWGLRGSPGSSWELLILSKAKKVAEQRDRFFSLTLRGSELGNHAFSQGRGLFKNFPFWGCSMQRCMIGTQVCVGVETAPQVRLAISLGRHSSPVKSKDLAFM